MFKVVHAQLKSLYGSHKGALVLTCCAAYDVNSSPKYTNASDALVILSEVEPVRPLNASAIPGRNFTIYTGDLNIASHDVFKGRIVV